MERRAKDSAAPNLHSAAGKLWLQGFRFLLGKIKTFLIDLTPHDQWHLFKFHASHHALAGLLVSEATLVLLIALVPLFVGVVAACQKCSSNLCCLFGTIGSRVKISTAEAADKNWHWDSYQLPWFRMVLGKGCSLAGRTGASIELVVSRWKKCSSKLPLLSDPFEARSLHQYHFRKKALGQLTATTMNWGS